jgi:hypothetical protein
MPVTHITVARGLSFLAAGERAVLRATATAVTLLVDAGRHAVRIGAETSDGGRPSDDVGRSS